MKNKIGTLKKGLYSLLIFLAGSVIFFIAFNLISTRAQDKYEYRIGETIKLDVGDYIGKSLIIEGPETKENIFVKDKYLLLKPKKIGIYNVYDKESKDIIIEFSVILTTEDVGKEDLKIEVISEQKISKLKKKVGIRNKNLGKAFISIPITEITSNKNAIKVYWEEQNKEVDFEVKDSDNDGLIEQLEFESLSGEQTYIIIITNAEHLNGSRDFIRDIYEEVMALDDVWSGEISENEYVRVRFEKNLTKDSDIVIYARVLGGNPRIEVYRTNSEEMIAELGEIKSQEYNKIYLNNLSGEEDSFDLRIVGGSLEIDYIIDPSLGISATPSQDVALSALDNRSFVVAWVNSTNLYAQVFDTNGTSITAPLLVASGSIEGVDADSRVDVLAINSTNFIVAWMDGDSGSEDGNAIGYIRNGANWFSRFEFEAGVGSNVDLKLIGMEDRYQICYVDAAESDADVKTYLYSAPTTLSGVETALDGTISPRGPLKNLFGCAAINTTRFVGFWFDDATTNDPVSYSIRDQNRVSIVGQTNIDFSGANSHVAVGSMNKNVFVLLWYNSNLQAIRMSIKDVNNNDILSATTIDSNAGSDSRVAVATIRSREENSDWIVVAWNDRDSDSIEARIYNGSGNLKYNYTLVTDESNSNLLFDIWGYDSIRAEGICENSYLLVYTNSSDNTVVKRFNVDGSEWSGYCDFAKPIVQVLSPENKTYGSNAINFTINVTDESPVTAFYSLDGGITNYSMSSTDGRIFNATQNDLSDGLYVVNFYVFDANNNSNLTEKADFGVDTIGPIITINSPYPNYSNYSQGDILFNVTLNEKGSACLYSLDDGITNYSMSSDDNLNYNATNSSISDGLYEVTFYCNDTINNLGSNSTTFRIDTRPPQITIFSPDVKNYSYSQLDLNFSVIDEGVGVGSCWYEINGGTNISLANCQNTSFSAYQGENNLTLYSNDTLGNMNKSGVSFFVDSVYPSIKFEYPTLPDGAESENTFINVNVSVVEDNFVNITYVLYNISYGSIELVNRTTFYTLIKDIKWEGLDNNFMNYSYNVSVCDILSNCNSTETRGITLTPSDIYPPIIYFNMPSEEDFYYNSSSIYFEVVLSEKGDSVWYRINDSQINYTMETTNNITWNATNSSIADGHYKVIVYANDSFGNLGTNERNFSVDTSFPLIEFGAGTENNGENVSRDWIYVNVSVVEDNFANITFALYNSSGIVNESVYYSLVREINWSGLSYTNYDYNVSIFDKAGNLNYTETRSINLIDITAPSISIIEPRNITYYTNYSLILNYSVSDLHLDSCWYNLNGGENITLEECTWTYFDCPEGSNTLYLFANDSFGNLGEANVTFVANESLKLRRKGILVYGEGAVQTPRYRLWNGLSFSEELSANSVGGTIEWISVKASPVREEYIIVSADANDDINIQINGTNPITKNRCWHNGTDCGSVLEVTQGSTTINRLKADVAYETISGKAIVVWSEANTQPAYIVWNGSSWSTKANVPQILIQGGQISYVKMVSHPFKDEIALIMTNTTSANVIIWNGSDWGCEPSSLISMSLTPDVYQHADLAYEQSSGDLFIVTSVDGVTAIDYTQKLDGSCNYVTNRYAMAEESEQIAVGPRYKSDYIMIVQRDVGGDDLQAVVWDGDSMRALSGNEQTTYTGDGSPSLSIAPGWTGISDKGVLVYSDAAISLNLDYFLYNISTNTWNGGTGGLDAAGLTDFADEEQNIFAYSFIDENKTMVIVQDDLDELWAKVYNGDTDLWSEPDGGSPLETSVSSATFPSFDFYFEYDIAGPLISVNTLPYVNYTNVVLNITVSEKSDYCEYSYDGNSFITMNLIDDSVYTAEKTMSEGSHEIVFRCGDIWGNVRQKSFEIAVDLTYPLIEFGAGTEENGSEFERDWIYVNVSVVEDNFANITFALYNSSGIVNESVYYSLVREINWSGLNEGIYYYNASICDKVNYCNSTETLTITLTRNPPIVNLIFPENGVNLSYLDIEFNFSLSDENRVINCSLYGNWSGGWHLNQTIDSPERDVELNFSIVNLDDGFYIWNVECVDVYNMKGKNNTNFSFGAFLFPSAPKSKNITQTSNDGGGNITLYWDWGAHAFSYRIYYSDLLNNSFVFLNETRELNYTDITFAGNKRRFYKIASWNPIGENESLIIFGAHVYSLLHNLNTRNWIGFPTNATYLNKAEDYLNEIRNATSFNMWNATIQKRVTCNLYSCPSFPSCTETNCNFDLVAGNGYEVHVNSSASSPINWSLVGFVQGKIDIYLNKNQTGFGKNWIGVYANTTLKNATELLKNISKADAVTRWNPITQRSEGLIEWGNLLIGYKFNITMEEGYEVSVNESMSWEQF